MSRKLRFRLSRMSSGREVVECGELAIQESQLTLSMTLLQMGLLLLWRGRHGHREDSLLGWHPGSKVPFLSFAFTAARKLPKYGSRQEETYAPCPERCT